MTGGAEATMAKITTSLGIQNMKSRLAQTELAGDLKILPPFAPAVHQKRSFNPN
jgi:hypothetical protein